MTNKTKSKSQYVFQHYNKTVSVLTPFTSSYNKRLFKDHHHSTNIKLNIPEEVSYLIYGS